MDRQQRYYQLLELYLTTLLSYRGMVKTRIFFARFLEIQYRQFIGKSMRQRLLWNLK